MGSVLDSVVVVSSPSQHDEFVSQDDAFFARSCSSRSLSHSGGGDIEDSIRRLEGMRDNIEEGGGGYVVEDDEIKVRA